MKYASTKCRKCGARIAHDFRWKVCRCGNKAALPRGFCVKICREFGIVKESRTAYRIVRDYGIDRPMSDLARRVLIADYRRNCEINLRRRLSTKGIA